MFIDQVRIFVKAGAGGNGVSSFRREKFVPRGGPDGGDGGDGGHVVLTASNRISTLLDFRYKRHYEAQSGEAGQGSNKHGRTGSDVIIFVPVGTLVKDEECGEIIADLTFDGQTITVARGGQGGRGNAHFATPTNRAPRRFENGTPGEERQMALELKLLADVGLVGFPNAGKSTFIASISSAHPEIASYPFTTLRPHLGVVGLDENHSFVVADIPGLIEGAHQGKGLGFQFLRHIQRTAYLLFLIDISEWVPEDPISSLKTLRHELGAFDDALRERPFAVVASKLDCQGNGHHLQQIGTYCKQQNLPFFSISSVTREGLPSLLAFLGQQVTATRNSCETNC